MCQRKYTDQVVADMQRIAGAGKAPMRNLTPATITEAQRQGAQKLALELRQRVEKRRRHALLCDDSYNAGVYDALGHVGVWLDELCPPPICDDPAMPEPLTVADYVTVE